MTTRNWYFLSWQRMAFGLSVAAILGGVAWQTWQLADQAIARAMIGEFWVMANIAEIRLAYRLMALFSVAAVLYALWPRARISDAGIKLDSVFNLLRGHPWTRLQRWQEITEVKRFRILCMRYVRVTDKRYGALYGALQNEEAFQSIIARLEQAAIPGATVAVGAKGV